MCHPALNLDPELGHVGELDRVVLARPNRLGQILPDLGRVDVEGRGEDDVTNLIAAEVDVHEPRHELLRVGALVELDTLHERRGAVAHADDRYPHLVLLTEQAPAGSVPGGRGLDRHRPTPRIMVSVCLLIGGPPNRDSGRGTPQNPDRLPRAVELLTGQGPAYVPDPLPDRQGSECRHHVYRGRQQLEVAYPCPLGENQPG